MGNVRRLSLPHTEVLTALVEEPGDRLLELMFWLMSRAVALTMEGILDDGRKALFSKLTSLNQSFVKLDLLGYRISDAVLTRLISSSCSSLQELRIHGCGDLTRETWQTIGICTKVKRLEISRVNDASPIFRNAGVLRCQR